MIQTYELQSGGYYMIESLSSGRSCYFENEEEINQFRILFHRYLGSYCKIHKMYLGTEGYKVMLQVRHKGVLCKRYRESCRKRGREIKGIYIKEEWRIISEQIRIFHSVFVKMTNRMRDRQGVLVQSRYRRYYFETEEEYKEKMRHLDEGEEIKSQRNAKYRVGERWRGGVRWGIFRGGEWVESLMDKVFKDNVVPKMIKTTLDLHKPPD